MGWKEPKTTELRESRCLTSAVLEQSWHYDKVDEAVLEKWLEEIRSFERERVAAAEAGPLQYHRFWKSKGGFRTDGRDTRKEEAVENRQPEDDEQIEKGNEPQVDGGTESRFLSETYLTEDLWLSIFSRLDMDSLPQCASVCKQWRRLVKDGNIWAENFRAAWKLASVVGSPSSTQFWRGKLSQFAISHELSRMDTVASLAVKYNVQVMDIRRQNMMMSDHGIHSRERVLIPITKADFLEGKECFVEVDPHARREVAVVYLDGRRHEQKTLEAQARARARAAARFKEKVTESFKRSLGVDDGTASYYLDFAGGDVRGAYAEYLEDLRWERRQGQAAAPR